MNLDAKKRPFGLVKYTNEIRPEIFVAEDADPDERLLVTGGFFSHPQVCPDYGCIAMIMDHEGNVYHTWSLPPENMVNVDEFGNHRGKGEPNNLYLQGTFPTEEGGLIVTLQGRNVFPYYMGVLKLDWDGKVVWKNLDYNHHWSLVTANGEIVVPAAKIVEPAPDMIAGTAIDTNCEASVPALYQEAFQILDADGNVLRETYFEDLLKSNDLMGLAYATRDGCDPYHINGVAELNEAAALKIPHAEAGDLLISLRSPSALLVVDRTKDIVHAVLSGPMVAQHSPVVFPNGEFGVFDNLGGNPEQGGSRILILDPANGNHHTVFPIRSDAESQLSSVAQGTLRLNKDGTELLIAETLGGRLLEVDTQTGAVLWEYLNISDLRLYKTLGGVETESAGAIMNAQGAHFVPEGWLGLLPAAPVTTVLR